MLTWRHPALGDKLQPGERVRMRDLVHECHVRDEESMRMRCGVILPARALPLATLDPVTCLWCAKARAT